MIPIQPERTQITDDDIVALAIARFRNGEYTTDGEARVIAGRWMSSAYSSAIAAFVTTGKVDVHTRDSVVAEIDLAVMAGKDAEDILELWVLHRYMGQTNDRNSVAGWHRLWGVGDA